MQMSNKDLRSITHTTTGVPVSGLQIAKNSYGYYIKGIIQVHPRLKVSCLWTMTGEAEQQFHGHNLDLTKIQN